MSEQFHLSNCEVASKLCGDLGYDSFRNMGSGSFPKSHKHALYLAAKPVLFMAQGRYGGLHLMIRDWMAPELPLHMGPSWGV